jgi:predicted secreted hydrolase
MAGSDGHDRLSATMGAQETMTSGSAGRIAGSSGLALALVATLAPTLHRGVGWIDFGPAGGSYYYSRTRMAAMGELTVDGRSLRVEGSAWFDHQWGDFISVGGGGWDWFAIELPDGADLMLSLVRDAQGDYPLVYGTLVRADGTTRDLGADAFSVTVGASWRSPRSGGTYPARWTIDVPSERLVVELAPTVADQELDTRATTGVIYWEGSQRVVSTVDGRRGGGEAYVELTGYAP